MKIAMERTQYKSVSNARINGRIKQLIVLVLTIIMGILISISTNH